MHSASGTLSSLFSNIFFIDLISILLLILRELFTTLKATMLVLYYVYVMWNLFTVGSLQVCNDSTIASLEANKNRPKIKYYVNK